LPCVTLSPTPATVSLNVTPNILPALNIVATPYQVAWENMPFYMTLSATGCSGTYNWSATGLPAGLSVTDATNGVISGIPGPGTCGGPYTVIVTVTDTSCTCPTTCPWCCPPVSRPFTLIVDCWANYPIITYSTYTACDFDVEIGLGLKQGQAQVMVDGKQEAMLGGGQSETFTSQPCQSHLVTVPQTILGQDPNTRFTVVGLNYKTVTDTDNHAYFDYALEAHIETGSDPIGVSQPPGTGFHAIGSYLSTTAPSPVASSNQEGEKFLFREWSHPDGNTSTSRDLLLTVNKSGKLIAKYDRYFLLQLKSDSPYPIVDESQWVKQGENAAWNLALQKVPMDNFFGTFGGRLVPINSEGSHLMAGPYTQQIKWRQDWFWPIFWGVVTLLGIAALIFFFTRRQAAPVTAGATAPVKEVASHTEDITTAKTPPVVPPTPKKKASPKAKSVEKPNFCPKCGATVEDDALFCKKCGKEL
jgi:hypothetical protein